MSLYDAVIIGGGPAGLTAAIYLARARYSVVVLEKDRFGGQITITEEVVNYPGIKHTSGKELTEVMRAQAESFGAEFMLAEALSIDASGDIKKVETTRGTLEAFSVLLATGAHPRMIGFDGESDFRGRGVAYCATCDGEFFTDREVFVVGGGFAAAEESVFLTRYAKHVTILVREDDFTCAASVADNAKSNDKITIHYNTQVLNVKGDDSLKSISYRNDKTGEITEYKDEDGIGVFVFAGYEPETGLLQGIAEIDSRGYVKTNEDMMTTANGIFAAGDVRIKTLRQVVTATGDGALAATEMEKLAAAMQKKTGRKPEKTTAKPKEETTTTENNGFFSPEIKAQLDTVFSRMEKNLVLEIHNDSTDKGNELLDFMEELATHSKGRLSVQKASGGENLPFVRIIREDGSYSGISFHGVPSGHEFTSFILGLYNAGGKGQNVSDDVLKGLDSLTAPIHITILVSLSCTMCPELVTAAERLATLSDKVTVDIYDASLFPLLRAKYKAMSVPCFEINGKVHFGRKNTIELLNIIKES